MSMVGRHKVACSPKFWPQYDEFHIVLERHCCEPVDIILELCPHLSLNIWIRIVEVLLEGVH